MAKFHFRLATLLRLREATRDERRAALAEAYQADDTLAEHLAQVQQELAQVRANSRQAVAPGPVNVDQLIESQRYELTLRAGAHQIGRQRELVAAEIARRRETLMVANREVRVLEKLREQQQKRHLHEENLRAIKLLDEVGQRRTAGEDEP